MNKNFSKKEKGFVALFTVLLTSVILAMSIGIASIALKEIVLSSSASEGTLSFYAADSGIECALYKERNIANLLTEFGTCNGSTLLSGHEGPFVEQGVASEVYTFQIPFGDNQELCADIVVKRQVAPGAPYSTLIESKGSNVACDDTNNPRRVERSVRVTY